MSFSRMVEDRYDEVLGNEDSDNFDDQENLYRTRRDEFRNNEVAINELAHWKARDDKMEYKFL